MARLGGFAGRRADVSAAARARDVDAAVDRMDPGRARIGHDDAGRAEDREAADDAEAPVGGALGDLLAAGDRDLDNRVDADAEPRRDLLEIGVDHRARRRIDRRLADGERQAGPRHRADAFAGLEAQARARRREAHGRHDQRAMGDVRIVARVLDDAGAGESCRRAHGSRARIRASSPWAARPGPDRERRPVSSASKAARAAPLAQAPVVQPRLRGGVFGSLMRAGLARGAQFA